MKICGQWFGPVVTEKAEGENLIGLAFVSIEADRPNEFSFTFINVAKEPPCPVPHFVTSGQVVRSQNGASVCFVPDKIEARSASDGTKIQYETFKEFRDWLWEEKRFSGADHFSFNFQTANAGSQQVANLDEMTGFFFNRFKFNPKTIVTLFRSSNEEKYRRTDHPIPEPDSIVDWAESLSDRFENGYFKGLGSPSYRLTTSLARQSRYDVFRFYHESLTGATRMILSLANAAGTFHLRI